MKRQDFIERVRRLIYGGQPPSDASITIGLVNNYLPDAIAAAAKANYIESIKLDGISYVNNSFYTTYKGLAVTADEQNIWKILLPEIPIGIGMTDGIETLSFKDSNSNQISQSVILLSQNQRSFQRGMRPIPNKIQAYSEGNFVYAITPLLLNQYTAQVTMISGGDSTDLNSTLNVPPEYFPMMMEYLQKQLLLEQSRPVDAQNDGLDAASGTT